MIVTLTGTNDYQIETELKKIILDFETDNDSLAIEQIDASESELQIIQDALSNLSFLTPRKLIVIRRGQANKLFTEHIDSILTLTPESNSVVIVESHIDKRLSYYKTLKKLTDFKDFNELEGNKLIEWVIKETSDLGGEISNSNTRHLIDIAGTNQLRLSNEIAKLAAYNSNINKDTIDLLVEPSPQSTIFQLLDAAFAGRNRELLRIYDEQKRQKVEPQQIIAMLTWQIHILAIVKSAEGLNVSEIAQKTKINPFVINKSMVIAKKLGIEDIKDLLNNLIELDVKLKNQTLDADEALLQLLLSINR